jgi:nicotinamidase-related amidase
MGLNKYLKRRKQMKSLLLIDIQNDYFPGGRMELVGSEAAGRKAGMLLEAFRQKGLPIFHVQHISTRPGASFFIPGTEGAVIHAYVKALAGEPVIQKNYPNSFRETTLLRQLREKNISELVVAGMMTHMCVDTTVRAACDLGFSCMLAHDACAARNLSFEGNTVQARDVQTAYMAALNGLFAQVMDTDTLCAGLE